MSDAAASLHLPDPTATAASVAFAALREVGRHDLADGLLWFEDDDGPYAEVNDALLDEAEWALVDRAETLGRQAIGLPERVRSEAP